MQSAAHAKWITEPSLKLALAALGTAAILFGIVAYLTLQVGSDSAASSARESAAQQSFAEANPRFLDMNALPEGDTTSYAGRQAAQSLQHYRFLDWNGALGVRPSFPNYRFLEMNRLPEAQVITPNYRFLDMNVLPGDDQTSDNAPIRTGQPS